MLPVLIIIVVSAIAQLFLPWWIIAPVAFGSCWWLSKSSGRAFLAGFLGIALVWLAYAAWIHSHTDGILTGRMSQLLFKADVPLVLLLLTPVIGGLVGGLAGLTGYQVRRALR
ncbi:hypothetical protein GCM10023189_53920 [Nibrella saemangeumensis]|uniref:Uncharacterized protein n=1 Tax=Nibrella saemangeumensis TaxID=1084526 RepID=A0ABP8NJY6_9BACT